jgi:hypothetical protein
MVDDCGKKTTTKWDPKKGFAKGFYILRTFQQRVVSNCDDICWNSEVVLILKT